MVSALSVQIVNTSIIDEDCDNEETTMMMFSGTCSLEEWYGPLPWKRLAHTFCGHRGTHNELHPL